MPTIYLVEGEWSWCDDSDHWMVAAFTTLEAAEKHRVKCQAWIDAYVDQFWVAFESEFGKIEDADGRRFYRCMSGTSIEESDRRQDFHSRWFNNVYIYSDDENDEGVLDESCGLTAMRRLSPDPQVEVEDAVPCLYSVVELELDPDTRSMSKKLGPKYSAKRFESWYCGCSQITEEYYAQHLVTMRCFCDDPKCYGWAAVSKSPEHIATHRELYGAGLPALEETP